MMEITSNWGNSIGKVSFFEVANVNYRLTFHANDSANLGKTPSGWRRENLVLSPMPLNSDTICILRVKRTITTLSCTINQKTNLSLSHQSSGGVTRAVVPVRLRPSSELQHLYTT